MSTTFAQLGVPGHVCRALEQRGFTEPFEIQAATISDALAGRDVCGRAPTGSGKTLAFGVPLVSTVSRARPHRPRGLVLVPTRELAEQITADLSSFAGDIRIRAIYGGVGYQGQLRDLRRGVDVVVACPGRLQDLVEQGAADLSEVDRVVLDEADQMADMGFLPAVRKLLDRTAADRQTVLFSATLDNEVAELTREYQRDPVHHRVDGDDDEESAAEHRFWVTDRDDRVEVGAKVIERAWPAVVFCRTRHGADRVARQLARHGIDTVAIHGGNSQNKRTRALDRFIAGKAQALVATDVAARGIHVDGVAAVLHFDIPADAKTYVHRSGRTARAGATGLVVSLVLPNQVKEMRRMQRDIGVDGPIGPADLDDPALTAVTTPARVRPESMPEPEGDDEQRRNGSGRRRDGRPGRGSGGGGGRRSGGQRTTGQRHRGRSENGDRRDEAAERPDRAGGRSRDGDRDSDQRRDHANGGDEARRQRDRDDRPSGGARSSRSRRDRRNGDDRNDRVRSRDRRNDEPGDRGGDGGTEGRPDGGHSGPARSSKPKSSNGPKRKKRSSSRSGKPRPKNKKAARAAAAQGGGPSGSGPAAGTRQGAKRARRG